MNCIICHGNDIREIIVNEEIQHHKDVILVPVKGLKCSQCGEKYLDQKTVRYLEKIRHDIEANVTGDLRQIGKVMMYEELAKAA